MWSVREVLPISNGKSSYFLNISQKQWRMNRKKKCGLCGHE